MSRAHRSGKKGGASGASNPPAGWTDAAKKKHAALAVIADWCTLEDAARKYGGGCKYQNVQYYISHKKKDGTLAGFLHLDMYKDAAKEGKGAVRQLAES